MSERSELHCEFSRHIGDTHISTQIHEVHGTVFLVERELSVRKNVDPISATRPTKIMPKTQNTLPPRFLSQPCHEVEVCRGREVSEAKVTMGPFIDNRADII